MVTAPVFGESAEPSAACLAYFGTYTGRKSRGIYVCRFDSVTGKLGVPSLAAETPNPTFLATHPNGQWLYAVGEIDNFGGKRTGSVSAYRIEPGTGKLTLLNQQPSGGGGPCHLAVDRSGRCLLAANYGSGSVASFKIEADGSLSSPVSVIQHQGSSVNRQRQAGPHAHHIIADPANRFVLACDLGLDQVLVYRWSPAEAVLSSNTPPFVAVRPGSGPRHLAFHPDGRFVYVLNELNSTLTSFAYEPATGTLKELHTSSTLPADFSGKSSGAEVQVHPSGKFVYTSNRGDDSIAIFSIDPQTGIARFLGRESTRGKTPRHFDLDPTGRWIIAENQDSDNVVVFRLDSKTGLPSPTDQTLEVGAPVCAVFVPAGKNAP